MKQVIIKHNVFIDYKEFKMKKSIVFFILLGVSAFASEAFKGCNEMRLNEAKSIFMCPNGDYEVTFQISAGKRDMIAEPTIKVLSEKKPTIIQYIKEK